MVSEHRLWNLWLFSNDVSPQIVWTLILKLKQLIICFSATSACIFSTVASYIDRYIIKNRQAISLWTSRTLKFIWQFAECEFLKNSFIWSFNYLYFGWKHIQYVNFNREDPIMELWAWYQSSSYPHDGRRYNSECD